MKQLAMTEQTGLPYLVCNDPLAFRNHLFYRHHIGDQLFQGVWTDQPDDPRWTGTATTMLVYNIYRTAFQFGKLEFASAQGIVLLAIIFFITWLQFRIQKRNEE